MLFTFRLFNALKVAQSTRYLLNDFITTHRISNSEILTSDDRETFLRIDHQFHPFLYRHPHSDSQAQ
jgi:hypothetical protein